ncbi:glutamate-1-semialdehyde-2,1-aminomutase [Persicimonas caeni]|uniref:Glutamate-1-semialdehyde 2,1-aminomutase n=1 Tax=Persicimonas caeni TaxID=2292766 RepID=A0A4Y6Q1B3_PERCE|nr:glutamate-1-semialdehyde 2,1-aminomutase [Persicimonas caeni]QDG54239.1 glutamate-1-semialdehyde-2,1-aminomutase [Persicimonas caeni]QED35460.1 glutamate-1-semialdehyde-2,1-aminomutase [Persicimonas caeni]
MLEKSQKLLERARKTIPGGVNSPVRAFNSVGGTPPFIKKAEGAYIFDEDDNRYIDFVLTWGPAILGHANPKVVQAAQEAVALGSSFGAPTAREVNMAEMIVERVPGLDRVRLVNSGTEACMSAIRVARGAKGRDKIIKFEGCYHGHADSFLIAAGSGALTLGVPNSPGVTEGTAKDTLLAEFNNIDSVRELMEANKDEVAAVILEPICGNTGCIPPLDGFLTKLRELCDEHDVALIIDEVMTGFRVSRGGAAQLYDVQADIYCFGKVIGGGFPLAAYGGTEEMMSFVAPDGPVYQAGTLSGNPVAVAAGTAQLEQLDDSVYEALEARGQQLQEGMQSIIDEHDYPLFQHRVGSMFSLFFSEGPIRDHEDVKKCDIPRFNKFFHAMLDRGVYLAPSQFEAGFLATAHTEAIIDEVLEKAEESLAEVF